MATTHDEMRQQKKQIKRPRNFYENENREYEIIAKQKILTTPDSLNNYIELCHIIDKYNICEYIMHNSYIHIFDITNPISKIIQIMVAEFNKLKDTNTTLKYITLYYKNYLINFHSKRYIVPSNILINDENLSINQFNYYLNFAIYNKNNICKHNNEKKYVDITTLFTYLISKKNRGYYFANDFYIHDIRFISKYNSYKIITDDDIDNIILNGYHEENKNGNTCNFIKSNGKQHCLCRYYSFKYYNLAILIFKINTMYIILGSTRKKSVMLPCELYIYMMHEFSILFH